MGFEKRGDLKRALESFKSAASEAPDDVRIRFAVARTYEALGDRLRAAAWYLQGQQIGEAANLPDLSPGDAEPDLDPVAARAWVERLHPNSMGPADAQAAIDRMGRLLTAFGRDETAFRKLGLLLGRLGRVHEARQFFVEADAARAGHARWGL